MDSAMRPGPTSFHILLATVTLVVFLHINGVTSQLIWYKNARKSNRTIEIPITSVRTGKQIHPTSSRVEQLLNYTLDEKCEHGLGIGITYQAYNPYVNMGMDQNSRNLILSGIFPHLLQHMLEHCCPRSKVEHARYTVSMDELERHYRGDTAMDVDFSFPVYGHKGGSTNSFRDFPLIELVTAPKIAVLVQHHFFTNLRVKVLLSTILDMWPMLVFIMISACLAGLVVWWLDKKTNRQEFPEYFFQGSWEGIWCAFITMTTVGYGDCAPKSFLARIFCILWILLGTVTVSLFTGLVASAVQTTSRHRFNIHGTPIGAIRGSIEYQVGVGLNADMQSYDNVYTMIEDLVQRNIHAAMVDNFIFRASKDILDAQGVHMEQEIDHPVTYGLVLAGNSTKVETCFRRYVSDNPNYVFEVIAETFASSPISTEPAQLFRQTLEAKMVEEVLYEDDVFKTVLYAMVGLLVLALCVGTCKEYIWNGETLICQLAPTKGKLDTEKCSDRFLSRIYCSEKQSMDQSYPINSISQDSSSYPADAVEEGTPKSSDHCTSISMQQFHLLISEYEEFHTRWIAKVKSFCDT